MSGVAPEGGRGSAIISLAGGILALAGLVVTGLQLRSAGSELDALEDRINNLPASVARTDEGAEASPVLTAADVARFSSELNALQKSAGSLQAELDRRILIDPKAEVPGLDPVALAKFAGEYLEIRDRAERLEFSKDRLDRCIKLADETYLKLSLAKQLKLDEEQVKKISKILSDELSRSLDYLARKDHPSDEATELKKSILDAADQKIQAVLTPEQLKIYPKHKQDWIGGMLHIAGTR